ncbi:hypothetical protein [Amphibacillus cookii]|uniref:hypothetical protein n=1 Tax=Amphibacillus cookii TaxID=767787 RepID=UPI001958C20C|nr:hypothetical protein [Amphibacillus cookii]MBM7541853.1 hypothetical protein [Amphibacillus cookii]
MKKIKILFFIIISSIFFFLFYYYNGTVTEGYFTVAEENILVEKENTFLFLNNHKIEVPPHLISNIK